jgi:hypothetical protein
MKCSTDMLHPGIIEKKDVSNSVIWLSARASQMSARKER